MGNKILDVSIRIYGKPDVSRSDARAQAVNQINTGGFLNGQRSNIQSVMDWVRVGLNGNLGQYKDLPYGDLVVEASNWHNSLEISGGDINYVEENPIFLDFRNSDGFGFYWVSLDTNDSPEECKRMGHCGRTNYSNTIISLRENMRINEKFTINKSHLSAAVGKSDGIIYQLKGEKNSKPKEIYHKFIIPLLLNDTIKGFGYEYNSKNDFKISDLKENEIKFLYEKKPLIFNRYPEKKILASYNLIPKPNRVFTLTISASDVNRYVEGDFPVATYKDKEGNKRNVNFFEAILNGSTHELYDPHYGNEWKTALQYYVDKESTVMLWDIIRKIANRDGVDIEGMWLENAIDEVDDGRDIINALNWSIGDAEQDNYYDKVYKVLKSSLEQYGKVEQMDDEGVKVVIDLETIFDTLDEDVIEDVTERCEDNLDCMFNEILGDYYDRPKFFLDDRWTPDVDEETFNNMLQDRLNEIDI